MIFIRKGKDPRVRKFSRDIESLSNRGERIGTRISMYEE
jgi:hypothetical protein